MMSIIILIPGFFAAYIAWTQSPHKAFIYVFVPVLLFLPTYYSWSVPGLPDPNFQLATISPIVAVWIIRGTPGWRFSFTDFLVLGYALSIVYSEFLSPPGAPHFQNFVANMIGSTIFPYILAKSLIEPAGLREEFVKIFVIVLLFVTVLMLPQSFTGSLTIWQRLLGRFFGGQGWQWHTQYRWGLARSAGPYGHAILAGIVMVVGYRLQRWLEWSNAWPKRLRRLPIPWLPLPIPWLPLTTPKFFTLVLFVGALITLVRGPLSAAVIAAIVLLIGRSKKRWLMVWILVAFLIFVGIPTVSWFVSYASVDPDETETRSHQTVTYRWQLLVNYIDVGKEEMVWGWGRFGWPKVGGQKSIDNFFLLLFLMHGIMGFGFFVTIFLTMMVRLFIHSMLQPIADPPGSSLGFTLLSLYIVIAWSIVTVWLGGQTLHLLFLIVGWSEGYLHSGQESLRNKATTPLSPSRKPFKFRRVL